MATAQNKNKVPATNKPSTASSIKSRWKKSMPVVSLKTWARAHHLDTDVAAWLHNKKANTSKPAEGIGRTNRINKGNKK